MMTTRTHTDGLADPLAACSPVCPIGVPPHENVPRSDGALHANRDRVRSYPSVSNTQVTAVFRVYLDCLLACLPSIRWHRASPKRSSTQWHAGRQARSAAPPFGRRTCQQSQDVLDAAARPHARRVARAVSDESDRDPSQPPASPVPSAIGWPGHCPRRVRVTRPLRLGSARSRVRADALPLCSARPPGQESPGSVGRGWPPAVLKVGNCPGCGQERPSTMPAKN
jgi:hypothetical protein